MLAYFEKVNSNLNARFFSRFGYQQRYLDLFVPGSDREH